MKNMNENKKNNIFGVYKIINMINGKTYIGSTSISFNKRWSSHKCLLNKNKHTNVLLQKAWNKYGGKSFIFEIVEIVDDKINVLNREQHYIDEINIENKENYYNICKIAGSTIGMKHSDETKLKISMKNTGCVRSDIFKQNISNLHKNNKYNLGRVMSNETKDKISKNNTGHLVSDETKIKISNSKIGHLDSVEHKNKISGSGNPNSKLSENERSEIIRLFYLEKLTKTELSKKFNITYCTIRNILLKNILDDRRVLELDKKYKNKERKKK